MLELLNDPKYFWSFITLLLVLAGISWWGMFYFIVICRKRVNKIKESDIHQYLIRTAFCFEKEDNKQLGVAVYWRQKDIEEKANSYGLSIVNYIKDFEPRFNFDVETMSTSDTSKLALPLRLIVKRKDLDRFTTLFFRTNKAFIQLTLPNGEDPYKSYWLGTVVECDCPLLIRYIAKRTMKGVKRANTCHVVRP